MKKLHYIIAAVLIVFWAIAFFILHSGSAVHLFLLPAAMLFLKAIKNNTHKTHKHPAFKPMQLSLK